MDSACGVISRFSSVPRSVNFSTGGSVLPVQRSFLGSAYSLYTTISFDPSAASGFGHVGIGVNTGDTVGQRPQDNASQIKTLFGHNVPGEISPDPHTENSYTVALPTTPTQGASIQQCIDDRQQRQEYYDLYNNNFAQFVQQCLRAVGINVSNTVFPARMFQSVGGQIFD